MQVKVKVYKVIAAGQVGIEAETVEEARDKALIMVKSHSLVMKPVEEQYVAVVIKDCLPTKQAVEPAKKL